MIDLGDPNFDEKEIFNKMIKYFDGKELGFWGYQNRELHRHQLYNFVAMELGIEGTWHHRANEVNGIGDGLIILWKDRGWIQESHWGDVLWITQRGVEP